MPGLGGRLPRLPRELTALFCVILRQSPRRGCSRTPCTLRLPTGAFPCLTLKYRRQRTGVLSRSASKYRAQRTGGGFSLSDAKISPSGNERFYKRCPAEGSAGEIVRRSGLRRGHKAIKARGGRPLRACFDFNSSSLSRARKILQACPRNFSALFLDKTSAG